MDLSTPKPDAPVCTCIKGLVPGGRRPVLVVLDPYCQLTAHKEAASFAIEPYYPRNQRPDSQAA